jgi:hypothetical protein
MSDLRLNFEYTEVDAAYHRLGLNVRLPFAVREDLDCIPLDGIVTGTCFYLLLLAWEWVSKPVIPIA